MVRVKVLGSHTAVHAVKLVVIAVAPCCCPTMCTVVIHSLQMPVPEHFQPQLAAHMKLYAPIWSRVLRHSLHLQCAVGLPKL